MYNSKWKKRIAVAAVAIILVLVMIFSFNKFILQNPTRLRTIALNKSMERIQYEIDNTNSTKNTIRAVYDEGYENSDGIIGLRSFDYFINDNEDRKAILSALRHSSYIYGTPAYQPLPVGGGKVLIIGDLRMDISYFPHIPIGGYTYQVDKHNENIIKNILAEIRDDAGLEDNDYPYGA